MTTIAYHHIDGQIAVDGRISSGNLINTETAHKWIKKGNDYWFLCGPICDNQRFVEHLTSRSPDKPKFEIECSGFLVRDGEVHYCCVDSDSGQPCISLVNYSDAVGSGASFAISAMDHGNSAIDAVKYAGTRDSGTGPNVYVFSVSSGEFVA